MKKQILFLLISCFFLGANYSHSQTVGVNTENPNALTELDVKNLVNGGDTIPKGIMVPRMTQKLRDQIDVSTPGTANSLLIYNTDEDCYNYYSRLENEWQSLCGKLGKAQFEIADCSTIKVFGFYENGTSIGSNHYIKMTVEVTKAGSYSVTAVPDPDNGYYFSTTGEFLTTGTFDIILQGAGTPKDFTPEGESGDPIKFYLNGIESVCSNVKIKIDDSSVKPVYTMECSSVKVNGVYKLDTPVTAGCTITMSLTVDPSATGATYIITTDVVDGISFSGSGILVGGSQLVTLQASGTPNSMDPKVMTITCNSSISVATCKATVYPAYTKKRLLTIGSSPSGYGYNFSGTAYSNQLLTTASNFGLLENSIVKSEGFEIIDGGVNPSEASMRAWLVGSNPVDIVVFGFDNASLNINVSQYLADYLSNGGVILAFQDRSDALVSGNFIRAVLGDGTSPRPVTGALSGWVYPFSNIDHEILNGPFGDIRGLQWGEDASTTQCIPPSGQITILSTDENVSGGNASTGNATAFVHKTLNLVWVGDGGFNSATNNAPADRYICPFNINSSKFPIAKENYGRGTRMPVYNSIFTANAIAWAMKKAQFRNR